MSIGRSQTSLLILGMLVSLFMSAVSAEEGRRTLEEVKAFALSRSPAAQEIDAVYATNLAHAIETRLLFNPELSASVGYPRGGTGGDKTTLDVALSQPFQLSQFGLRRSLATMLERAATTDQRIALLDLSQTITLLYYELWSLQQKASLLKGAKGRVDKQASLISKASKEGVLGAGEVKLFEANSAKLDALLDGILAEEAHATAKLREKSGFTASLELVKEPVLGPLPPESELIAKVQSSPLGITERFALLKNAAEAQVKVARSDSFPIITPQVLASRDNDGVSFIGVGISIPLPFWNRNQAEILRSAGALKSAAAKMEYVRSDAFTGQLKGLIKAISAYTSQTRAYQKKVIPAYREALSFQENQFRVGQASVLQIYQTQRELTETELQGLEFTLKSLGARLELNLLVGNEL